MFFTQLQDIEKEIGFFDNSCFKDKTVLCNCNDGIESNFWVYFHRHFREKGLRKLIGISYDTSGFAHGMVHIYEGGQTAGADNDIENCTVIELRSDGDFRDAECIAYLQEADIVVTNPPFSLFKEYVRQLVSYNKKFLIVGNQNAITNPVLFPLIQTNKVRVDFVGKNNALYFINTQYIDYATTKVHKEGMIRVAGVVWYTNLELNRTLPFLKCVKKYNCKEYPKYDLYDIINVDKVQDVPLDYVESYVIPSKYKNVLTGVQIIPAEQADAFWEQEYPELSAERFVGVEQETELVFPTTCNREAVAEKLLQSSIPKEKLEYRSGVMGVPITFLSKYNLDQFEIIGCDLRPKLADKVLYKRIFIRRKYGVDKRGVK